MEYKAKFPINLLLTDVIKIKQSIKKRHEKII